MNINDIKDKIRYLVRCYHCSKDLFYTTKKLETDMMLTHDLFIKLDFTQCKKFENMILCNCCKNIFPSSKNWEFIKVDNKLGMVAE